MVTASGGLWRVPAQLAADRGLAYAHALGYLRLGAAACIQDFNAASLVVGELAIRHGHSPLTVKGLRD